MRQVNRWKGETQRERKKDLERERRKGGIEGAVRKREKGEEKERPASVVWD